MKNLYTFIILMAFGSALFAQSPSIRFFTKSNKTEITNGAHTIYGDGAQFVITEEFYSVLEGVDSNLVGAKRYEIATIAGTAEYYCWKECYLPTDPGVKPVWYAADSLMLYENDTVAKFSSYLNPQNNKGVATYRYVFTPKGFPNDSTYVDITFDIQTIGLDESDVAEVNVFPNPASSEMIVDLGTYIQPNTTGRLLNANGQQMKNFRLSGYDLIDVSDLESGLYLLEVQVNGLPAGRRKVLVNH